MGMKHSVSVVTLPVSEVSVEYWPKIGNNCLCNKILILFCTVVSRGVECQF